MKEKKPTKHPHHQWGPLVAAIGIGGLGGASISGAIESSNRHSLLETFGYMGIWAVVGTALTYALFMGFMGSEQEKRNQSES